MIGENITVSVLFIGYVIVVLAVLLYRSAILATILIIALPAASLLIFPEASAAFLSSKRFNIIDDTVPIYNVHILLFIWASLLTLISYSELVSWYLTTTLKEERNKEKNEKRSRTAKKSGMQVKIPFKPLENILIKMESLISKR
ncbi:MAG: hypothetical protein ACXQTM_04890 [Methanosarcinales archaeon]